MKAPRAMLISFIALIGTAAVAQMNPTNDIAVRVHYLGFTRSAIKLRVSVSNRGKDPVYIVRGHRMPYVAVANPRTVELAFMVTVTESMVSPFEVPDLLKLDGGKTRTDTVLVEYPFRESDHYHRPGPAVTTGKTFSLEVTQGYGTAPFDFHSAHSESHIPAMFRWQKTAVSNRATITIR